MGQFDSFLPQNLNTKIRMEGLILLLILLLLLLLFLAVSVAQSEILFRSLFNMFLFIFMHLIVCHEY